MIIQCPACRALVAVDAVIVDGAHAGLTCDSCAVVSWLRTTTTMKTTAALPLPAPPLLIVTAMPSVSTMVPAPAAELVAAAPALPMTAMTPLPTTSLADAFADDVVERINAKMPVLSSPSAEQAELAARFSRLLGQWHNDAEHKQLLKAAALTNELPLIGARYRAVLDVVREEPRARAAQQELISLAMVTMNQTKAVISAEGGGLGTGLKVALGLITVLAVGGAAVAGISWMKTSLAPLASTAE